jgi:hypothetical protein
MAYLPGFVNDVFISYTHKDNIGPEGEPGAGWVSRFHLDLQRRFHAEFALFGDQCWDHYRPGAWVPHVTLATNVTSVALATAVELVCEQWKPLDARLDTLRLIQFHPVTTLAVNPLALSPPHLSV